MLAVQSADIVLAVSWLMHRQVYQADCSLLLTLFCMGMHWFVANKQAYVQLHFVAAL